MTFLPLRARPAPAPSPELGIGIGLGAATVVVAGLLAAAVPVADQPWRFAVMVIAVVVFGALFGGRLAVACAAGLAGTTVECAKFGEDYSQGVVTPIRGDAPDHPAVPADAVTASGSGLDPDISVAYARLQAPRVARTRGVSQSIVDSLINQYTTGRALGFMGQPGVNVVRLNLALDQQHPMR